jgi:hypothetical protein
MVVIALCSCNALSLHTSPTASLHTLFLCTHPLPLQLCAPRHHTTLSVHTPSCLCNSVPQGIRPHSLCTHPAASATLCPKASDHTLCAHPHCLCNSVPQGITPHSLCTHPAASYTNPLAPCAARATTRQKRDPGKSHTHLSDVHATRGLKAIIGNGVGLARQQLPQLSICTAQRSAAHTRTQQAQHSAAQHTPGHNRHSTAQRSTHQDTTGTAQITTGEQCQQ